MTIAKSLDLSKLDFFGNGKKDKTVDSVQEKPGKTKSKSKSLVSKESCIEIDG